VAPHQARRGRASRARQDFWPNKISCGGTRWAVTRAFRPAHFEYIGTIRQIIQSVLEVAFISTSFAEKLEHHDAYRHEVIHTAGERLQQEV
jgi:hypothetical protein